MGVLRTVMRADMFRVLQDRDTTLTKGTSGGGALSMVCLVLIALGVANESYLFFRTDWHSSMSVSRHALAMEKAHFNITFDHFPCYAMEFEAVDVSTGRVYEEQQQSATVQKWRVLEGGGVVLGPHSGGSGRRNENGEGCRVEGEFLLDKVPGQFSISAKGLVDANGKPYNSPLAPTDFTVHGMWFGESRIRNSDIAESLANAMGGTRERGRPPGTLFLFFINIVPTSFDDGRLGFQYTSTHSTVNAPLAPGVYVHHVHSPLSVLYHPARVSWGHFATNVCAVVGGVFTVVSFGAAAANKASTWFRDRPPTAA